MNRSKYRRCRRTTLQQSRIQEKLQNAGVGYKFKRKWLSLRRAGEKQIELVTSAPTFNTKVDQKLLRLVPGRKK